MHFIAGMLIASGSTPVRFSWGKRGSFSLQILSMHKLSSTTMVINGSSNRSSIMKGSGHFKRTQIVVAFTKQIELNI